MEARTGEISITSSGENDIIDITEKVSGIVKNSNIKNGNAVVFVAGSTGAVTTIEYEPGLKQDFPSALSRIAPQDIEYEHHKMWHDGNGHSHVKASLVGPSLTIPIIEGNLVLGTWQQIVFVELDTRSRNRRLVVQVLGE